MPHLSPHLYRKGSLSKCGILPDVLAFSNSSSTHPDLSKNGPRVGECVCVVFVSARAGLTLHTNQPGESGLARHFEDERFAYAQVPAPRIYLITF